MKSSGESLCDFKYTRGTTQNVWVSMGQVIGCSLIDALGGCRSVIKEDIPVEKARLDAGAATVETCDSSNAIAVRALLGFVDGVFPGAVANGACDDFIAVAYYTHLGIGALLGAFTLVLSPGDEGNATANAGGAGEEGQDGVLFEHARCGPSRQSAPFGHIDHWLGPEGRPAQWRRPFDAGRQ